MVTEETVEVPEVSTPAHLIKVVLVAFMKEILVPVVPGVPVDPAAQVAHSMAITMPTIKMDKMESKF